MAKKTHDVPEDRERGWGELTPYDFTTLQILDGNQKFTGKPVGGGSSREHYKSSRLSSARDDAVELSQVVMRRRKRHEEHENIDRWLVSYADFVTLLFAFFVVMYAISSLNEGKYRVLSESLVSAFHTPARSLAPIQVGELVRSPAVGVVERVGGKHSQEAVVHADLSANQRPADQVPQDLEGQKALDSIAQQIGESLAALIKKDLISIRRDKLWLEVEIKTSILFPSGSAALEQTAMPILGELANILKDFPNPVQVEGFTDDVPISSVVYPSNWELSAGRAATVVHLFSKSGVKPERMAAIGYGEFRPTDTNSTPEGRSKNRRVVLQILAQAEASRIRGIEQGAATTH